MPPVDTFNRGGACAPALEWCARGGYATEESVVAAIPQVEWLQWVISEVDRDNAELAAYLATLRSRAFATLPLGFPEHALVAEFMAATDPALRREKYAAIWASLRQRNVNIRRWSASSEAVAVTVITESPLIAVELFGHDTILAEMRSAIDLDRIARLWRERHGG